MKRKIRIFYRKTVYVLCCLFGMVSVFLFFRIPRARGIIKEICLDDKLVWNKGGRLFVSNHPSWLDQFLTFTFRIFHWNLDYLPYVAVADDSIKRIPFLKFLKDFCYVVSIERKGNHSVATSHIRKMKTLLDIGYNLMMAGAQGRDFKGVEEGEIIFSPLKNKPLRKFTELCGLLASLPGVETMPFCLDGTEKLYREVKVDGKKEMKFSVWNFFVLFWLLGKIQITIVYGYPLILEGKSRAEATEIIQQSVLHLLDLF